MSRIRYEIFGKEGEILFYDALINEAVEISFTKEYEGLLSVGSIVVKLSGGSCRIDKKLLPEGEYEPILVTKNFISKLPGFIKEAKGIRPLKCKDEYIRSASVRTRRLEERIEKLEETILHLNERINGTTII